MLNASTCLIQEAGVHPKGMSRNIEIRDAEIHNRKNEVTATMIDCEGLVRFANPQGLAGEAICGFFPRMQERNSNESPILIVDVIKLGRDEQPSI